MIANFILFSINDWSKAYYILAHHDIFFNKLKVTGWLDPAESSQNNQWPNPANVHNND